MQRDDLRGNLFALQMIQQFVPLIIARCELRPCGVIDRHRYITHCPGLPAIHNVNSGELTLVEVHIEHAAHLAGVLHAYSGQGVKLFAVMGCPPKNIPINLSGAVPFSAAT